MSVYNEIEMRFAKLRWRMDWPVDLYNVSSRSSIVRCKINSYFYLSRIVWNGNYFDRKIKNVELLTSYDDWTVVDCYRRSCCIMDSSHILPNTDCFKHKNKITSDKHWHCSMICLLTTTTKKMNMLEKKCTCLVCFDWTQDLLLNLTLWFCMKYYARVHSEQRLYHKCNNSVPVTSSTHCA